MQMNFNTEPYYDDYDELNQFYKILFRPGYAVQARELTQLQTILQKQVSRFGDHIFKNGSMVIPGSVNVDNQVHFAKVEPAYDGSTVSSYITSFVNKIITGSQSGVKARVIDTSGCTCVTKEKTKQNLYFKIEQTGISDAKRFIPGEDLVALEIDNQISTNPLLKINQVGDLGVTIKTQGDAGEAGTSYARTADAAADASSNVLGFAYMVDVKEGVYYINGTFVKCLDTHYYVGRFDNRVTARVGFHVVETAVSSDDDESLLDNAQNSPNFAAPGADRYKINLEVIEQPVQGATSENFIELVRIVDGRVQHIVNKASYAELEKTLARRTFDESGSYEVNKFKLAVREHLDNGNNFGVYPSAKGGDANKFALVVEPGKAYVEGYEIESVAPQFLALDKARDSTHVNTVNDQSIATQSGNYVLVSNVYHYPDFETYEQVQLVKVLNSSDGAAPAVADVVGTARVKSFELHSSDYSGTLDSVVYKLGLLEVNMYPGYSFQNDVKQIVSVSSTPVRFTCDIKPDLLVLAGSATSTTGSTAVTGVGTNFIGNVVAGDVVYIDGVVIGRVASTPTSNLSLTLSANGLTAKTGGQIAIFRASIQEPEFNFSVFKVGQQFIQTLKPTGADTTTIFTRKTFTANASSGSFTATLTGAGEFFESTSDLSNYTLINNSTNLPIAITTGTVSLSNGLKTVTITGLSNVEHTLIATVKQSGAQGAAATKTLQVDYEQTITDAKKLTGNTIELAHADIYRIVSVLMTPGDFSTFDVNNNIDITHMYELDNGQRPSYYTNGKLNLKSGFKVPSGAVRIKYDYFLASGTGNYFSVDSYVYTGSTFAYENIPVYKVYDKSTKKVNELCLSCALDFRPIIAGLNTFYPKPLKIGEFSEADVSFYIARQDKLVLDSVGRFAVLKGVPSLYPKEPEDPKSGMVLASIYIPPYTKDVRQIKVYQRDNRRYTMRDIGKLERRISNLEYYVALNALEKDTETMQIKDAVTGLDKFKNGFIVDQFTGHGVGDVKNEDYKIAVDSRNKRLRPMHFTTDIDIVEDIQTGADRKQRLYDRTGDLITLPYTEEDYIFNEYASRSIDVNPYKIGAFKGEIVLTPEGDNWKDTDRRPDLQVTDDNNYDAIAYLAESLGVTGTFWDEWQTNWTGSSTSTTTWQTGDPSQRRQTVTGYETTVTTETGTSTRTGTEISLESTVNSQDYGDRVVDIAFTPYMRARPVTFIAKNLKTNARFWAFFDDVDVNNYVKPADVFKVTRSSSSNKMSFDQLEINAGVLADDPRRTHEGKIEPAFSIGDVLTNTTHTAVNITSINGGSALNNTATQFNITVSSASGISVGHHVFLYNLNRHEALPADVLNGMPAIPASIDITNTSLMAKELNIRKFKVTAVSGLTLTLKNIDDSVIGGFSAHTGFGSDGSTDGYTGTTNLAKLLRLQASGVAVYGGAVYSTDSKGNLQQDVYMLNIKNGFAVNDVLTGTVTFGTPEATNAVTVNAINASATVPGTPSALGAAIRSDVNGAAVGVFYLPNNDALSFRTGERKFKLIDNQSNSDADFDSKGSVTYFSQGITLTKERTIVNSRTATFAEDRLFESVPVRRTSTSTRVLYSYYTGHDPVAQTFTVSALGGVFITSVDLYFRERGNRPVIVELRNTNNGVPSSKVVPMTTVMLDAARIAISDNGSVPTRFDLPAPTYLQDGETYALVVRTDEPGAQLFVSELGQRDIITQNIITAQPLTGSVYLSQNSREFLMNPLMDMKFTMRKAKFDISASVDVLLKGNPPSPKELPVNPFEITPNTNKVRVYAPNHGFVSGDKVIISDVAIGNYGGADSTKGIPHTVFNTTHTIISTGLDKDSFIVELKLDDGATPTPNTYLVGGITTANLVKGEYGGTGIMCTRALLMDTLYLKTSDLDFPDTDIRYSMKVQNIDGSFDTNWVSFVTNSNYDFPNVKHLKSYENQTIVNASPLLKKSSILIKSTLSSTNANVSPVIDLQKVSAYSVRNLINNYTQTDINVPVVDDKILIKNGTISAVDKFDGVGTLSITQNTSTVTLGTATSNLKVGYKLFTSANVEIGTISTINSTTSLTLISNYTGTTLSAVTGWYAKSTLMFTNDSLLGLGMISTNVDAADNFLANAEIGKYITVAGVGSGINGTYVVRDISVEPDTFTLNSSGNAEADIIKVYVYPTFTTTGTANNYVDISSNATYVITQLDKYVEDFAPTETTNAANYITRTLSLNNLAENIKIMFDANILTNTSIKVYYRTWTDNTDLRFLPYVDAGFVSTEFNADGEYTERTLDIENITAFNNVSLKIVMKSSDTTLVPSVKNLRMIAYS